MASSTLKKEFNKRDVQRMRNIITQKTGDRTQLQAGWEKQIKEYKEGDIWEENGKQWTIKNGIKQTITKLDTLKKIVVLPISCPCCKQAMKSTELNRYSYSLKNKCFDCSIKEEDSLKISGEYEKVVEQRQKQDAILAVNDLEAALDAWYTSHDNLVNEQGDIENWSGGNKKEMYDTAKSEIAKFRNS
jgi:hypothetical protein